MFKRVSRHWNALAFMLTALLLMIVLAACELGGGSGSSSTATPTPTPKPTPSPTPTTPALNTYHGNGYTISYPQDWKISNPGANAVQFSDSTGIYNFLVSVTANPEGVISTDMLINGVLTTTKSSLKNPQTENVPPTATVGGDTWTQKSESGDTTVNSQNTTVKVVILADNHPASSPSTNGFVIVYGTGKTLFDSEYTTYFQRMLQSFKFT